MELLVIIIEQEKHLRPILDQFYERDISGATVIDSKGMGHLIADHIPIFAQFAELNRSNELCKTIFTVVEDEEKMETAIRIVEETVGDLTEPDTGMFFTVPISHARGYRTRLTE